MSNRTDRQKRAKREEKLAIKQQQQTALLNYLGQYGSEDDVQSAGDSAFDAQIKNLSLPLASYIASHKQGTILDIGCGKGILLKRLTDMQSFVNASGWIYLGIDFEENLEDVLALARANHVHRRVEIMTIPEFYSKWPTLDVAPKPYVAVVRNVFHELTIDQTSSLLFQLIKNVDGNDLIFLQDLQVFPVSERGNSCWIPEQFCGLLKALGFDVILVEEPTAKGNRWFTIQCRLTTQFNGSIEDVKNATISARKLQLGFWKTLGWLAEDDEKFRPVHIAKLDFDLQYASLLRQLIEAGAEAIPEPSQGQQVKILQKTFQRDLSMFKMSEDGQGNLMLLQANSFRDRANYQDGLERFLREGSAVIVIYGGALSGKTALVKEVLSKRAYNKQVVVMDIQASSSVWNLLEQILTGVGCKIAPEIYGGLKKIGFDDIKNDFENLISTISDNIIFAIDHFERLLDPNLTVVDPEIRELLKILAVSPSSKLIITSRNLPALPFIPSELVSVLDGCPIGRFPEGNHVENVLNDFVNLSDLGVTEYPDVLLRAIDRHPYLSVLAGLTLRKDGGRRLTDPTFLEKIKGKMREALLRYLVDDLSQPAMKWLSFIRVPIPRQLIEGVAGKASVAAAEQAGLVYTVFDRYRNDLVVGLGGGIRAGEYKDDLMSNDDLNSEAELTAEAAAHQRLAIAFGDLYRKDDDPRWLREICYHKLATGDKQEIEKFGVYYKSEIFWATDYSYRIRKDYEAALWALEVARGLGLRSTQAEMRRASCLVRLRKPEGELVFQFLIDTYPNAGHIKNAYVDSLLYLGKYQAALDILRKYEMTEVESSWIAQEFGRAYFGLRQYSRAAEAFELQLKKDAFAGAFVYDNLARAYQHQGDWENESRILTTGLARHPTSNRLQLRHASHMIRQGTPESLAGAKPILEGLHLTHRTDGRVLQQYCKLLCKIGKVADAKSIWQAVKHNISPPEYSISIHVDILIQEQDWVRALKVLEQISNNNEHLVGMKKSVYLAWANSESDDGIRRGVARQGLDVEMDASLNKNIPLLIITAKLSRIAEDDFLYQETYATIDAINHSVALKLDDREEAFSYWD